MELIYSIALISFSWWTGKQKQSTYTAKKSL